VLTPCLNDYTSVFGYAGVNGKDMDARLKEIEINLVSQEDTLQQLSQTVYQQQRQIDELRALYTALAKRLGDANDGPSAYADERPPHY
jgi:SlyX protein